MYITKREESFSTSHIVSLVDEEEIHYITMFKARQKYQCLDTYLTLYILVLVIKYFYLIILHLIILCVGL